MLFLSILGLAALVSLVDWRRGWLMAVVIGILQDPIRKITPGTPPEMTFSILIVYFAILFGSQAMLQRQLRDLSRRFAGVSQAMILVILCLFLAAVTGLVTFGIAYWKVPALSLFIYLAPLPAVLLGYAWMKDEDALLRFFRFYSIVTSIAMIGCVCEYLGFTWPILGLVAQPGLYIRHLPGVQIPMLSGFYRAPDIMGWHAATLGSIGIGMAVRGGMKMRTWPWMLVALWGFVNCLISGRRKAVYMLAVFALVLVWRYFRRLTTTQLAAIAIAGVLMGVIVSRIASDERSSVYAKGTVTSREEVWIRLEGGLVDTFDQYGLMGAGLGSATQGVHHLTGKELNVGWQEGGLGKLAVELGLPGLAAVAYFAWILAGALLRLARAPDIPGSSQLVRVILLAILVSNIANFMVSAQAYSDAVLILLTAFFVGCFLGTATLSEKFQAAQQQQPAEQPLGLRKPATV
jgi:hypothetical protein